MTLEPVLHRHRIAPHVEVAYIGPPLSAGPLPALFYFALSDSDSLCLDPFNQPVSYLSSLPMRIFSLTLPGHENNLPPTQALYAWAAEFSQKSNPIANFVEKVKVTIDVLMREGALFADRIAVAGLSRGAFVATHAAAAIPYFQWILGFAPLTKLSHAKEFQTLSENSTIQTLSLENLTGSLIDRKLRFYIGNRDTRVGTRHCFDFIEKLSQEAFQNNIRSPSVELIIGPSIGRDGHGTSREVFHHGAQWVAENLRAIDVV